MWEELRAWLGSRLKVCPKEITVLGSARTGFSLKPETWGHPFHAGSDLDLAVVSSALFTNVVETYQLWVDEYESGTVVPRGHERRYWDANRTFGQTNIPHGFYDLNKLPALDRYPIAKAIMNTMWLVKAKLERTPGAPSVRHASIRVYRDWASLVARVSLNLMRGLACVESSGL